MYYNGANMKKLIIIVALILASCSISKKSPVLVKVGESFETPKGILTVTFVGDSSEIISHNRQEIDAKARTILMLCTDAAKKTELDRVVDTSRYYDIVYVKTTASAVLKTLDVNAKLPFKSPYESLELINSSLAILKAEVPFFRLLPEADTCYYVIFEGGMLVNQSDVLTKFLKKETFKIN